MIGEAHALVAGLGIGLSMPIAAISGRRHLPSVAVLALLSVAWFGVDQAWEGAVLIAVEPGHGLTLADLYGVAGLAVALLLTAVHLRRHVRARHRSRVRPLPYPRTAGRSRRSDLDHLRHQHRAPAVLPIHPATDGPPDQVLQ